MSPIKTIAGIKYLDFISDSTSKNKPAVIFFHGQGDNFYVTYLLHSSMLTEADWYFPNGLYPASSDQMKSRCWFPEDSRLTQYFNLYQQQVHSTDWNPRGFADILNYVLERLEAFVAGALGSPANIILAGFSQGAMFLPHLASRFKQTLGLILLSTNPLSLAKLKVNADKLQNPKLSFLQAHGTDDKVCSLQHARYGFDFLCDLGYQGEFMTFQGGHEVPTEVCSGISAFIQRITDNRQQ